jgi:hypothetical protein
MKRPVCQAVLVSLLLVGCSSIQTAVQKAPGVDFHAYRTWDWYPGPPPRTGDPRVDLGENLHKYIKSTIEKDLAGRGYERSSSSPDLYVDYQVTLQDVVNSQVINNYYGESFYPEYHIDLPGFQETYEFEWEEGALLLMIFDSHSKELVWRGIARTQVNVQGPRKHAREKIDKAVKKLVDEVPKA